MKKLAIKGHATRGKEVIELFEMLGGRNTDNYRGNDEGWFYFVDDFGDINCCHEATTESEFISFTLEEFLEKFPYKVGDKVIDIKTNRIVEIYKVHWSESNNCTYYDVKLCNNTGYVRSYKFLQPYKEETMEEIKIYIPEGYEFHDDKGNVINTSTIELVKKQPEYPKTYEECHELMVQWKEYDCNPNSELILCDAPIHDFCKLIVARNIYWKIAGEQMGLGKPWEPSWQKTEERKFCIIRRSDNVVTKWETNTIVRFLVFPSEEMRDAFFENFKDLIEECKVFL